MVNGKLSNQAAGVERIRSKHILLDNYKPRKDRNCKGYDLFITENWR